MRLETSAAWRGWVALFCVGMAVLSFAVFARGSSPELASIPGALWLFGAFVLARSRAKVRRRMLEMDYQARAFGRPGVAPR